MTDFLLELRSEEIPARMQVKAKADLARLFTDALAKAGLAARDIKTFATPRRLALIAKGLPLATEAVAEETKGPKIGAPPQAMEGFLRKVGLTQDQLVERDGVYFAIAEKPGRKTADVLAEAIPQIIRAFPWPKSQRWGAASASTESLRWVRPLQGIIALLGDNVVNCEIDGIVSGRATMGHRFHSSGPVEIANAAAYVETLRSAHVIVHLSERCRIIRDGAKAAAEAAALVLVEDEGLVTENAGLTEWPVPMLGRFDTAFLSVPQEVIQLTARVNQKYFVCHDKDGKLAHAFVCTANIQAHDGGAAIVAGNEKVLAARLSDAKFFWEQDLKIPLDIQAEKLAQITFHEKLGTVADKVERVAKLAKWLVEEGIISLPQGETAMRSMAERPVNSDPSGSSPDGDDRPPRAGEVLDRATLAAQAERAAHLCKADLVTGMVGEFPELQGIMGGYYARAQGEPDAVADAVRDHYKPVGQGDDVPTAPVTVAVSLADKLDTIAQFFAIGMPPSGSKDPFAIRRAGLAVLRLITENEIRIRLFGVFSRLIGHGHGQIPEIFSDAIITFLVDRMKVQQRELGLRYDVIDAVFAARTVTQGEKIRAGTGDDDLLRVLARVKALQAFVATQEGADLLAGYKRAANILKQGEAPNPLRPELVEGLFSSDGEKQDSASTSSARTVEEEAFLQALDTAEPLAASAIAAEDFEGAMAALASLRAPIDAFFDGVMVNDPDPEKRSFRIGLLTRFRDAVHRVADFSRIEG